MLRICKNNLGLDFVRHLDDTTPAGQICWQVWTENQMSNATPIQWIISCCDVSVASVHLVLSKLWMSVLMSLIRMQLLTKAQLMFHLESVEPQGTVWKQIQPGFSLHLVFSPCLSNLHQSSMSPTVVRTLAVVRVEAPSAPKAGKPPSKSAHMENIHPADRYRARYSTMAKSVIPVFVNSRNKFVM